MTKEDQVPISGTYLNAKELDKMNKKLDKIFNEKVDSMTSKDQATKRRTSIFHIIEDVIDTHFQGFLDNKIIEGTYFTKTLEQAIDKIERIYCHDELVEALKSLLNEIEKHHLNTFVRSDLLYKAQQALSKAKESET